MNATVYSASARYWAWDFETWGPWSGVRPYYYNIVGEGDSLKTRDVKSDYFCYSITREYQSSGGFNRNRVLIGIGVRRRVGERKIYAKLLITDLLNLFCNWSIHLPSERLNLCRMDWDYHKYGSTFIGLGLTFYPSSGQRPIVLVFGQWAGQGMTYVSLARVLRMGSSSMLKYTKLYYTILLCSCIGVENGQLSPIQAPTGGRV